MKQLRFVRLFILSTGLFVLAACGPTATSPLTPQPPAAAQPAPTPAASSNHPNIVFILTDDLDVDGIKVMPKLKALMIDQGVSFSNFFLNVSLCCPSRTTTLRGQYAHNTQIYGNALPEGGFEKVYELGLEKSTVATWLQAAGYKTMLAGKYLNGYPRGADLTYIPPGWNEWYSASKGTAYGEFNYTLNENGKLVAYGSKPEDYGTDVYARKAIDFIQRTSKEGKPFFVYLATYAPHAPSTPAPRHANLFPDAQAPRTPNFNEADVSDKPAYTRNRPLLTEREIASIDAQERKRLQSLQAVDEAIAHIIDTLKATGQLDNTYIFFGSDNGFHLGNHRLTTGKQAPYEEDIRVPMIVRGPGVPAGQTVDHLTGNIDYAPTWAEIAGAQVPDFVDGRSLLPLLRSNPPPISQWRQEYLLQHGMPTIAQNQKRGTPQPSTTTDSGLLEPPDPADSQTQTVRGAKGITPFVGIRTKDYAYVEYVTGETELYDLKNDPYQINNMISKASPDLLKELAARLAQLKKCAGTACRSEESAPF